MIVRSGIAQSSSIEQALDLAFSCARENVDGSLDGAFVFVSGVRLAEQTSQIMEAIWRNAHGVPIFGCSAESLVGTGCEIEGATAASVMLLFDLPEPMQVFPMECLRTPDGLTVLGIQDNLAGEAQQCNGLVVVACPMTFSIEQLAMAIEPQRGDKVVPILGGYCSNSSWESPNLLFCNEKILSQGAVGLIMPAGISWKTIVSQGCRPIGEPMIITGLDGDRILSLGGRPALQMLSHVFQKLPNHDRELAIESLLIGRAITEYSDTFSHGDFLVRNVQGIESETNSILVNDRFQVGQTIRFHVRDGETAHADLCQLLSKLKRTEPDAHGGLIFSCNGRGQRMFEETQNDASSIQRYFPGLPLSGIFAAGEFAPVGNRNVTHGFTAVVSLLCSPPSPTIKMEKM